MQIRVLGCSGGVGPGLRTTGLLVDERILIDAGSGVGDLSLAQMSAIEQIYLTHSHLDHTCGLAFLADNLFDVVNRPILIHAIEPTIQALRQHLFNWVIWPDFTVLPCADKPVIRFNTLEKLVPTQAPGDIEITAFKVHHTVPAVGYSIKAASGIFAFSGDTDSSDSLWDHLNSLPRLDKLVIEVAFRDEQAMIGEMARHFTPASLSQGLRRLRHRPQLLLTHHKPGSEAQIERQCAAALADWDHRHLRRGDIIEV